MVRVVYLTLMMIICETMQASKTQSCLLKTTINDSDEKKAINLSVKHVARIELGLVGTKMSIVHTFFIRILAPVFWRTLLVLQIITNIKH